MRKAIGLRRTLVVAGAAMLLVLAAACGETKVIEVPGETVIKEVVQTVEVPGETVIKEVVKTVEVPGQTVIKEVVKTVEVPGETVIKEVLKTVEVPGETVVVEKEVVKVVAGPERIVEVVVEGERYIRNIWGQAEERPRYGGTITVPANTFPENFDPRAAEVGGAHFRGLVFEKLGTLDWALPRDQFPMVGFMTVDSMTGELAESWDVSSDLITYTFNLHKDATWHNKAPVSGRGLTAKDVAFTFQMAHGIGEFEGQPANQNYFKFVNIPLTSVTATDDYTVVVKSSSPSFDSLEILLGFDDGAQGSIILPREVYENNGNMNDWRNVVGSGAYELTDFVFGSNFTLTKNPNYWKYDPLFPGLENRLPYIDQIKVIFMPDIATQLSALRTGKIAMPNAIQLTQDLTDSLLRTNPDLVSNTIPAGVQLTTPAFRMERPPFDIENVRVAMQKAINTEEILFAYYKGKADAIPKGATHQNLVGATYQYDEWPEETRYKYAYDVKEAERLLDEAGYPRLDDGVRFKVAWDIVPLWGHDQDLDTVLASYWDKIGVDVTLNIIGDDSLVWDSYGDGTSSEIVHAYGRNYPHPILGMYNLRFYGTPGWISGVTNSEINTLHEKANATTNREEWLATVKAMDQLYVEGIWTLALPIPETSTLWQPWLKSYRGERGGGTESFLASGILERVWIDQDLKRLHD